MKQLEILIKYFPTGTTEGERHILRRAFVQAEEFADLITPPPYSPRLLVGKKGSGKSALIEFSMTLLERAKVPALVLKPMDIDYSTFREDASVGELTGAAFKAILNGVAMKLGSTTSGLITGDDKILYETAVSSGEINRDTIERLALFLPKLAKSFTQTDLTDLLPSSQPVTVKALEKAISNNLEQSTRGFYLFIDDTDQIAAPDKPGHLNRIWAFLLAARELSSRIGEIRCIISLREEIWRRLTSDRAGQRDQTDHFSGLIRYLSPTRDHIRKIVDRRISLAAGEIGGSYTNHWSVFFEGDMPRMPYSEIRTGWPDMIIVRSRERPRDAVQLINGCCQRAISSNSDKITEDIFSVEMREFSKVRARLLEQEVEFECPQMEQIIRSLAEIHYDHSSFKATAEVIKKHLSSLGSAFSVTLFGRTLKLTKEDHLFELWRFLYDVGLLNARIADSREKDGFRHIYPSEDPTLVSKSRWNEMQAIVWEIGPAYRDHLISIQEQKNSQFGLPPRGRRP
ncbi:hypothetical protein EV700_2255 [Fluviicoccus keumensis]|uniref:AAA ATPase-like protein n=1 Tax=Fluviicoccus keumensis TaxID=1435465 RepID=A0A4Q7YNT8_9GAMM|nr:hypothetical protein [Fluviicoccus keumensis]RZU38325.1 hypothetical protein EV700_2255 [Fluviicoccus keumensis]